MLENHNRAPRVFDSIMTHFELSQPDKDFKPLTLLRLMKEAVSAEDDFLTFVFTLIEHDRLGNTGEQINPSQTLSNLDSIPTWHGLPSRVYAVKSDMQATSTLYTSNSSVPLPR